MKAESISGMDILRAIRAGVLLVLLLAVTVAPGAYALGSQQNPQSGSMGLEATVPSPPPTEAATIAIPSNGQVFTSTPITISGLCKTGLLVKVFSNNVFIGSVLCTSNSYSLKADLFSGQNDLIARVYDALDQQGPDSNTVSVVFNDAQFAKFGSHVALTSNFARRGADPQSPLSWPLILSGGTGPYALSIDWGDGNEADLKSVPFPGVVSVQHVYTQAGIYTIVAKATDANNTSAYLQLVGVANGKISGALGTGNNLTVQLQGGSSVVPWVFVGVSIPLLILAFWLGKRHELVAIRHAIETSREEY